MGTQEIENPYPPPTTTTDGEKKEDDDNVSSIEHVQLTVTKTGTPTLPVWTFKMWFQGVLYCCLLSFLHQFFSYRIEPHIRNVHTRTQEIESPPPPTTTTVDGDKKEEDDDDSPIEQVRNVHTRTQEIENPPPPTTTTVDGDKKEEDDDDSPIEQVRQTVANTDDPTLPVWTFRMWFLGVLFCCLLSFVNQFLSYRTESVIITQIVVLPIGRFMYEVLPRTQFRIPGCGDRLFSLNPGPFNMKEHVLITIFANAGSAFGNGPAYAVGIINIINANYHRKISFVAGWILVITTQVLGYGWAGLFRKYVVEPPQMWWPGNLVQVTLFRASHEEDEQRMSREKFFSIAVICSFSWYLLPGYLFPTLASISWVCWAFPKSVTAQQIGSGFRGLGVGALTLDWSTVSSFLLSPLIAPFFSIVNIFVGYVLTIYIAVPISYWGLDLYGARKLPIYSSSLFTGQGQSYNISAIVNDKFELDMVEYEKQGPIHLSMFLALNYGFSFAALAATLSHVSLFHGREIYERYHASYKYKDDIHTRLMRKYEDIPSWWFHILLLVTIGASLLLCTILKSQVQIPWWGFLFACLLAFIFTLPISIITATTNQTPGLNVITEYIMGLTYPGRPIANVCFKVYGYMSMSQAVSFLNDFKLGHYMKIPPRSMFLVQLIGTIIAGTINVGVAWWLLNSIVDICQPELLPSNSPWTCPSDRVFFDGSVIWGLVGPKQIFGKLGNYGAMNFFFLFGAAGPIVVWLFHKAFPKQSWIPLVNLPVLLGAACSMPPATAVNYTSWIIVGTIFNFCIFRYRKKWWQRYNYVLSGALDTGVALMAVLLYFSVGMENEQVNWWGTKGEHCELATCPTAKGIIVDGCPLH